MSIVGHGCDANAFGMGDAIVRFILNSMTVDLHSNVTPGG